CARAGGARATPARVHPPGGRPPPPGGARGGAWSGVGFPPAAVGHRRPLLILERRLRRVPAAGPRAPLVRAPPPPAGLRPGVPPERRGRRGRHRAGARGGGARGDGAGPPAPPPPGRRPRPPPPRPPPS